MRRSIELVVTDDVMEQILQAQVQKAKNGDAGAARFVFELYASVRMSDPVDDLDDPKPPRPAALPAPAVPAPPPPPPPTPRSIPAAVVPPRPQKFAGNAHDLRREIHIRLSKGPASVREIAESLMIEVGKVEDVVLNDPRYFRQDRDSPKFHLLPE